MGRDASEVTIRLLLEDEIPTAERIYREAFSTHLEIPDPAEFTPGAELIGFRWRKDPARVYAAERDGELVGTNVATNWGSVGVFGPLTVRPDLWNAGIGRRLIDAAVTGLEDSGCRHLVLFTFPDSPKHVGLYQRYGYWPRFLTAITERSLDDAPVARASWVGYSAVPDDERQELLGGCRDLTEEVYAGLDLSAEIEALAAQAAGETVVLLGSAGVDAFALCHAGAGSEASAGTAFVKFAAARPGRGAGARFDQLMGACEEYAAAQGASALVAGLNLARERAVRILAARGYEVAFQGVAMHRPNAAAYDRPDRHVIDDWR
jgi:GNAT superfamily N-acetyltransferase